MSDIKWIKIVTDIFDDEKIKYIETLPSGDTIIVIWFRLLCIAGKSNSGGLLMMTDKIAYTDEMLSCIFNRDIKTIRLALDMFERLEMIEVLDNRYYLSNWEKHQSIEKLDKIREKTRLRVANHRQKQIGNVTLVTQFVTPDVTQCNAIELEVELDKELEEDNKNNNKDIVGKNFVKPTIKQVSEYCLDRKNGIDPEKFYDYYEISNWHMGKTKIKDWKACVRTWEKNNKSANNFIQQKGKVEPIPDYTPEKSEPVDIEALKERLRMK